MEALRTALAPLLAHPATPIALQLVGSLAAILALYGLARWLGLGGDVRLTGEDEVRALADAACSGFDAVEIGLDRARIGALVRDARGRVLLIRRHGARFASRELTSHEGIRLDRQFITVQTPDRHFGKITLDLGEKAQHWAASLRNLGPSPA